MQCKPSYNYIGQEEETLVEETEIIYPEREIPHESDQVGETTENRNKDDQAWQDDNDILTAEVPPTTFLPCVGQHIEDEVWLNQTRIQDDIRMNNIEEAKRTGKFEGVHSAENPNDAFKVFEKTYCDVLDAHAPVKVIQNRTNYVPYISPELKKKNGRKK